MNDPIVVTTTVIIVVINSGKREAAAEIKAVEDVIRVSDVLEDIF